MSMNWMELRQGPGTPRCDADHASLVRAFCTTSTTPFMATLSSSPVQNLTSPPTYAGRFALRATILASRVMKSTVLVETYSGVDRG